MRKILISILIVLLLVAGYVAIFKGMTVFGFKVLSFQEIKDKNDDLDKQLQKISSLTSVDQPKAMQDLNDTSKQLMIVKEEYNDKILYSSSENVEKATQSRPYEVEFLWTKLGKHAKDNNINLRIELRKVSLDYDIYFTITGSYVCISEFVSSIENDSALNFKIENFKIVPNSGDTETLKATFTVKGVNVKIEGNSSNYSDNMNMNNNNSDNQI